MLERHTDRSDLVVKMAEAEAEGLGVTHVAPEHLLLAIVKENSGVAASVLRHLGVRYDALRMNIVKLLGPTNPAFKWTRKADGTSESTSTLPTIFVLAKEEAQKLDHNYVGTEHLLLAIAASRTGVAYQVLVNFELSFETIQREVVLLLAGVDYHDSQRQRQAEISHIDEHFTQTGTGS